MIVNDIGQWAEVWGREKQDLTPSRF